MKMQTIFYAAAAAALAFAAPALAHHAVNAQFDVSKEVELTGRLAEVHNINPHSRWVMNVTNAQGQVEKWTFEGASPAVLRRSGIRVRDDMKVGNTYTFHFNPPRANQKMGYLRAMTINGRKVPFSKLADVRDAKPE